MIPIHICHRYPVILRFFLLFRGEVVLNGYHEVSCKRGQTVLSRKGLWKLVVQQQQSVRLFAGAEQWNKDVTTPGIYL